MSDSRGVPPSTARTGPWRSARHSAREPLAGRLLVEGPADVRLAVPAREVAIEPVAGARGRAVDHRAERGDLADERLGVADGQPPRLALGVGEDLAHLLQALAHDAAHRVPVLARRRPGAVDLLEHVVGPADRAPEVAGQLAADAGEPAAGGGLLERLVEPRRAGLEVALPRRQRGADRRRPGLGFDALALVGASAAGGEQRRDEQRGQEGAHALAPTRGAAGLSSDATRLAAGRAPR